MKRVSGVLLVAAAVVLAAGCAHRSDLSNSRVQDNFGVRMAKMNLWREAMFRFRRAVEINPADAMAHNNLAVAYEANGDFENARKEYLEALKLDRGNSYIQKNYSRYVEFLSRNKKRSAPKTVPAPAEESAQRKPALPPPPDPMAPTEVPPPPQPTTPPPPPPGAAQ